MATMAMKHEQTQRLWLPLSPNGGKNGATESAIAYAAFEKYYLMDKRSLRRVAQELGQSVKLLERWSSEFRWIERAAAWDFHRSNFGKPENWNRVNTGSSEEEQPERPWLPQAPGQGKDGTTETALNHGTFMRYLAMRPGQRSLRELARLEGKSETLMERWSSRFGWAQRAAAWNQQQARVFAAEHEQRQRERAVVEARKLKDVNERSFQLADKVLDRVEKMLAFPLTETVLETDASGRPITIWKPAKWSYTTVCELFQLGDRIMRQTLQSASEQYSSYFSRTAPEVDFED